jgi:hypothetical protein
MSVKHTHPDYDKMKERWERCNIAAAGHYRVQEAGVYILPRLSDQTNDEYESYKRRATFFNASWRTMDGLRGMIFRKPLLVEVPDKVEPMLKDIDLSGNSIQQLASSVVIEALKLGRAGLFLDYPTVVEGSTEADVRNNNVRPMIKMYDAFSIINWKTRTIRNRTQLSMVVLKESKPVEVNEFQDKDETQYRVLDLEPQANGAHRYRVRVFQCKPGDDGKEVDHLIEGPFYPKMNGKHPDSIPFQFIGVDSTDWKVVDPPLIDLVEVNFAHYRVTADYEHGCHFTGLPTAVIAGHTPDNGGESKFTIGSMNAWVFTSASAKASYLEFTGTGLNALKDNLTDKKEMMAVLGARMLEAEPSAVQSASTAAIHRGGEQSMLASIALTVSLAFEALLKQFCEYAGVSPESIKFELNRDFFPTPMDSLTITAIIAAWQNGAIDFETMIDNLKRGEVVGIDKDSEEMRKEIEKNPPPTQDVPTTPGDRAGNGPNQGAAKGATHKAGTTSSNPTITQLQNN